MSVTIEDFKEDFLNNFSQEHQDYIINFCNTFQNTFPNILDKETMLERISTISSIENVPQLRPGEGGRTEFSSGKNDIKYIDNLSEEDKKNIIYHELLHVLSRHTEEYRDDAAGLTIEGIREYEANLDDFYFEDVMLDEIMNEFYTVKLLENEGLLKEKTYTISASNYKLNPIKDKFRHFGNGYKEHVQLSEILNNVFGNDLLKAKLTGGKEFREMFNQKYKDLDIPIPKGEGIPPAQEITPYERFQFQIGLSSIYKSFETAIDIWKVNQNENLANKEFNLYDYLTSTKELMSFLPVREDNGFYKNDKGNAGIPPNLFAKITQMDKEVISQFIKPDITNMQDKDQQSKEFNNMISVIRILRENIDELTSKDIESASYGKIEEYTHRGRDCIVINTDSADFMTFINNTSEPNEQFTAYSKFKKIPEFQDLGYTKENEEVVRSALAENGHDVKDFTYATVFDAGQFGMWSLVKANDSYYTTTGEIAKVQLADVKTLDETQKKFKDETLNSELYDLISNTTISGFSEMSQNIRATEKTNEQKQTLDSEGYSMDDD